MNLAPEHSEAGHPDGAILSGPIRVGGVVVLFDAGRCIAGPRGLDVIGKTPETVHAILAAAQITGGRVSGKTCGTERSELAGRSALRFTAQREAGNAHERKSRSGTLLPLNAVCRRLRLGKGRLVEAVALGRVIPDFVTDTGTTLFRPHRLREISKKLKTQIKF